MESFKGISSRRASILRAIIILYQYATILLLRAGGVVRVVSDGFVSAIPTQRFFTCRKILILREKKTDIIKSRVSE